MQAKYCKLMDLILWGVSYLGVILFDYRLFGNEDVDLRQLPQLEEAPPPPSLSNSPKHDKNSPKHDRKTEDEDYGPSPPLSPKKDWNEVKEKEEVKKTPSKLDLVRAKLAEATKGKDRLGRPLLFSKSPSKLIDV